MSYVNLSFWIVFAVSVILLLLNGLLLYQLDSKGNLVDKLKTEVEVFKNNYDFALRDNRHFQVKLSVARKYLSKSVSVRIMNKDIRDDIREFLKGL